MVRKERIHRDEVFMAIAQIMSLRGTCNRARVGCVIVKDRRIISTGYVGSPSGEPHCIDIDVGCDIGPDGGCRRTVHAEANAIAFAAKAGISLEDSTLYTTMAPCYECAKLIINAGVKLVIWLNPYRDQAGINLLQRNGVGIFPNILVCPDWWNKEEGSLLYALEEFMEENQEPGM